MSHHCIWKVSVKIKGAVPVEGSAIPWPAVGDGGVGAFPWPAGTPRVAAQILRMDLGAVSTRMPLTARGGRDRARGPSGHPTEGWARAALVHRVLVCLSETWFSCLCPPGPAGSAVRTAWRGWKPEGALAPRADVTVSYVERFGAHHPE